MAKLHVIPNFYLPVYNTFVFMKGIHRQERSLTSPKAKTFTKELKSTTKEE